MKLQFRKNKEGGFTIIEMMIAVAIFLIVITMGVGALLNANLVHQKSQGIRSIIDNLSFTMEDMSRNIRTGYHYECVTGANLDPSFFDSTPQDCANGWGVAFTSAENEQWIYYISNGKIWKAIGNLSNSVQITSGDEVNIDTSHSGFSVIGAELAPNNHQQPFVTMRLNGTIAYKGSTTPFSIQTSVSQRDIGSITEISSLGGPTGNGSPAGNGGPTGNGGPAGNRTIDLPSILGVTLPVTGGTPVSTITPTNEYTGTVTWSPADNPFQGGVVYTATITITPKTGFTLTGVTQNFFTVAGATATNGLESGIVTAVFPATVVPLAIGDSYQGGIIAYILQPGDSGYDASMQKGLIVATSDQGQAAWGCQGTSISGADGTAIGTGNQNTIDIMAGCATSGIAARIASSYNGGGYSDWYLPSKDELNEIYLNRAKIGGSFSSWYWSSSEYSASFAWYRYFSADAQDFENKSLKNFVRAVRSFPATAPPGGGQTGVGGDTTIGIPSILGVTVPVTGATPVSTITSTNEYTGTVTWSPTDNPFLGSTVYTATITIIPETGFTLTGVPANFFTVAGAMATNNADSGVVSAVFPATIGTPIDIPAIAGVTAPVTGATPVSTIAATSEYTATISWSPNNNPFLGSTVYTATITITPKAGYSLIGVPANFFTVAGATATNSANTGIVSAVFPITITIPTGKVPPCGNYGDVNYDGYVTSNDAIMIQQATAGIITFTMDQKIRADVNKDQFVNSTDALWVNLFASGYLNYFPVCS